MDGAASGSMAEREWPNAHALVCPHLPAAHALGLGACDTSTTGSICAAAPLTSALKSVSGANRRRCQSSSTTGSMVSLKNSKQEYLTLMTRTE